MKPETAKQATTRRDFILRGAEAAAATAALTTFAAHSSAAEKPEPIRLGLIGCGGQMGGHVHVIVKKSLNVSIAWLCDVDTGRRASGDGMLRFVGAWRQGRRSRSAVPEAVYT